MLFRQHGLHKPTGRHGLSEGLARGAVRTSQNGKDRTAAAAQQNSRGGQHVHTATARRETPVLRKGKIHPQRRPHGQLRENKNLSGEGQGNAEDITPTPNRIANPHQPQEVVGPLCIAAAIDVLSIKTKYVLLLAAAIHSGPTTINITNTIQQIPTKKKNKNKE